MTAGSFGSRAGYGYAALGDDRLGVLAGLGAERADHDYTYHDDREPPGEAEAHTYHVHVDHYYDTSGPYLVDSYSWSEDYDVTVYTNPGDTINETDHVEETSGNENGQYYYSSNSYSYS